jgi:oligopeptide/dipeptide ABC transporter ATP-binding protein
VPDPILSIQNLTVEFQTEDGVVHAVTDVSYDLFPGETLGIVGESGSGKSVSVMSMLGLIPIPPGKIVGGHALYKGRDLLTMSKKEIREIRGGQMAMIFQDPMTSLNPVLSVGSQLVEAVMLHRDVTSREARERAIEGLREVGIPRAEKRIDDYPHQFSGGMRQRVMIAMALVNEPALLIADEPTTALDVTTQAQILGLIRELQSTRGTAVVLITHDLGVVAETADDIVVMYGARVVERAPVFSLFEQPLHPYTWGLLGSLPRLDVELERLSQIRGQPPSLLRPPAGCRFRPRCSFAFDRCRGELPEATPASFDPEHFDACLLAEEGKLEVSRRVAAELGLGAEAA